MSVGGGGVDGGRGSMRISRRSTAVSRATLACGTCLTPDVTLPAAAAVAAPAAARLFAAWWAWHAQNEKLPRITLRSLKFSTLDFHVDYNVWFQLDRFFLCLCVRGSACVKCVFVVGGQFSAAQCNFWDKK